VIAFHAIRVVVESPSAIDIATRTAAAFATHPAFAIAITVMTHIAFVFATLAHPAIVVAAA
jgi:hypothetical protein